MTQEQCTTKLRKFQHLTREKRAQIEILLCQGLPKVQIARAVGISCSALYNGEKEPRKQNRRLFGMSIEERSDEVKITTLYSDICHK